MANQKINTQSTKCDKNKGFCYDSIVQDFGVEYITEELLERFIKVTGKEPHMWLKRGIFFSHRDLDKILDDKEKGLPVYLYTGRGPTTELLHLGHMVQFMFIKWLQDVFDAIVIQMADFDDI